MMHAPGTHVATAQNTGVAAATEPTTSVARRWWPAVAGLAFGIVGLLDIKPWTRSEPTTWLLPVLAVIYLAFAAARGDQRRPRVLRIEVAGLVLFGGLAAAALVVDREIGQYLVAAGWIGHAAWDVGHHRDLCRGAAVGVVPRGYAEFCLVIDLLVGASLIAGAAL